MHLFKKKDIHNYIYVRQYHGSVVDRTLMDFVFVLRNVIEWLL